MKTLRTKILDIPQSRNPKKCRLDDWEKSFQRGHNCTYDLQNKKDAPPHRAVLNHKKPCITGEGNSWSRFNSSLPSTQQPLRSPFNCTNEKNILSSSSSPTSGGRGSFRAFRSENSERRYFVLRKFISI
jgi:hypothetical protein